jgi:hypothetical protein
MIHANVKDSGMVFGHGPAGYNKPDVATSAPKWKHVNAHTLESIGGKHCHQIVLIKNQWHSQNCKAVKDASREV